jgi:hypothetical protein
MPKRTSTKVPRNATILRTYAEFGREVEAFDHGERNLLIIVGPPGTSKSTAVRKRVRHARIIQGGSTAYRLYRELFENRNLPIVLDDADKVFRDKAGVFLLKLLTQTDPIKTLQWNSNTPEIRSGDLPAEFKTTSPTLIVANSWPQENPDIAAVEDRGHLIYFAPSFAEMHAYAKSFGGDEEIYDFVGSHLHLFDSLDLRLYFKAAEVKTTGERTGEPDLWKRYVQRSMMCVEKRAALDLLNDSTYASDNQRSKEFERITGMSGRQFYRYRAEIELRQGTNATCNSCA